MSVAPDIKALITKPATPWAFHQYSFSDPLHKVFGPIGVKHETDSLQAVIIGSPRAENYNPRLANPINRRSLMIRESEIHVSLETAQREFYDFREALITRGVAVATPPPRQDLFDQMYTRDPCGVIGDTLVIGRMATLERSKEAHALLDLIFHLRENNIGKVKVAPPSDPLTRQAIHFEFGDIFPHGDTIYIGLSKRTNQAAINWFQREFPKYKVMAIPLKDGTAEQEALHLDCAFNIAGSPEKPIFVIHPDSLKQPDLLLRSLPNGAEVIEVSQQEQDNFATNFLSLSDRTVVCRDICEDVANKLQRHGIETIRLPFNAAADQGGLFRCCSMPLRRESLN